MKLYCSSGEVIRDAITQRLSFMICFGFRKNYIAHTEQRRTRLFLHFSTRLRIILLLSSSFYFYAFLNFMIPTIYTVNAPHTLYMYARFIYFLLPK